MIKIIIYYIFSIKADKL